MPNQTRLCAYLIHLQDLIKKLDEVTQNSEIVEIRQKESECELEAARDRVQQQATEILLKASKTLLSSGLLEMCTTTTINMRNRDTRPGFEVQTQHRIYQQILWGHQGRCFSELFNRPMLFIQTVVTLRPSEAANLPSSVRMHACLCVCVNVCVPSKSLPVWDLISCLVMSLSASACMSVNRHAHSIERACAAPASRQHSVRFKHRCLNMRKLNNGMQLFFQLF